MDQASGFNVHGSSRLVCHFVVLFMGANNPHVLGLVASALPSYSFE